MGFRIKSKIIFFVSVFCFLLPNHGSSQMLEKIYDELEMLNAKILNASGDRDTVMLVSHKAMNVFLSEKIASYLSDESDLSLYKNYVTFNAAEGNLAIKHNFHQPVDKDDWVRSFIIVGARTNMSNTYLSRVLGKQEQNQIGVVLQKTWMGRPVTKYDVLEIQKQDMDRQRAMILEKLKAEMNLDAKVFEDGLTQITEADLPGQALTRASDLIRKKFYEKLRADYLRNFFELQSTALINSNSYTLITDHWTTIGVYLPLIRLKYRIAELHGFSKVFNYPLGWFLNHTRFWDSPKVGRVFLTFGVSCDISNSIQAGLLNENAAYEVNNERYKNFLTPSFSAKIAYMPLASHVGLSAKIEKTFGDYKAIKGIIGIPIVLIDKKGVPVINFECQLQLNDLHHVINRANLPMDRTIVGLTVGIPFSKIVY